MPVPRCDTCSRVLNADGSCVNVLECKNPKALRIDVNYYCYSCKHWFNNTKAVREHNE